MPPDLTTIEIYIETIDKNLPTFHDSIKSRASVLRNALQGILKDTDEYSEAIRDNKLLKNIGNPREISEDKIEICLISIFRSVRAKIAIQKLVDHQIDTPVLLWFFPSNPNLSQREKLEISIWMDVISEERLDNALSKLELDKNSIDAAITGHNKTIEAWKNELNRHEEQAKQLSSKYNFVGLTHAFESMEVSAIREKWILAIGMIGLGILALIPLIGYLVFLGFKYYQSAWGAFDWERLIIFGPIIISVEIIIIYFFRVLLKQHQSTKAQILQLRLRQGVCAFIEKYVEFSRKNQGVPLEKFESLIFSGLTPDPDKVPSTFDGLDSIAQLIRAARGSKEL